MPPRTRSNPKDFTGQQKARLAEAHQAELLERRDKIAMMHQAQIEALEIPVNLDSAGNEITMDITEDDLATPTDLAPAWVEIRTICDIEKATIGYGTEYNFTEGQRYRVAPEVASWLGGLGYLQR